LKPPLVNDPAGTTTKLKGGITRKSANMKTAMLMKETTGRKAKDKEDEQQEENR
jgi:hypothetical protein